MNNNVIFYERENGERPALDFIYNLPKKHQAKALWEVELLEEFGTDLKKPYADSVKGERYKGLWELRIKFAGDISRVFYFTPVGKVFVLLHGFVKKTNHTPEKELEKALRYMKECLRRLKNEH